MTNPVLTAIVISALAIFNLAAKPSEKHPNDGLKVRVVLYYPADVEPPKEAQQQLKKYADYARNYFSHWLNHWGYQTNLPMPFQTYSKGNFKASFVKGKHLKGSSSYRGKDGKIANGAVKRIQEEIMEQLATSGKNEVVWIFLHEILGENAGLAIGRGSTTSGGVCFVKFRPEASFTNETNISSPEGKNAGLRGAIHELGHALGLPHNGSHYKDQLGSSLMGKPDRAYKKENPKDDRVYLSKASAAMAWKSSIFAGSANQKERSRIPKVKLERCHFSYDREAQKIRVTGKMSSDIKAHSVAIANQANSSRSTYFQKYFSARIMDDGTFEVVVDELEKSGGSLAIGFCFENGYIGGSPLKRRSHVTSGFHQKYAFENDRYLFNESWTQK